jgi:hypothetical protein
VITQRLVFAAFCMAMLMLAASGGTIASPRRIGSTSPPTNTVTIGGAQIDVRFLSPGTIRLPRETLMRWVRRGANAVTLYYGQFPVRKAVIKIQPVQGDEIGFATADFEGDRGIIEIPVGVDISEAELNDDWVLIHEMVHFAFPLVDDDNRWVAEGMATYVEPIIRMRAGITTPAELWGEFASDMKRGLPKGGRAGDSGFNTRDRIYYGGALFCFLADLQIRTETNNKKGLEDALRAILHAGGNITSDWEPIDALRVGDRAVGTHALEKNYMAMKHRPISPNLPAIWQQLGVRLQGRQAVFDDRAPLAAVRLAINGSARK